MLFKNYFASAMVVCMVISLFACTGSRETGLSGNNEYYNQFADTPITQSLFADKNSTITEENIARILDGSYSLPQKLRVAVVRLDAGESSSRSYYYGGWNDEQVIKSRQAYLDKFTAALQKSPRVSAVTVMPEMLVPKNPGFIVLREAAVRMQADVVLVFGIRSDLYSKFKVFDKPDLKAFATTQVILMDVRTGLIPFSSTITKDNLTQRKKEEMDNAEASARVQQEAVLLTIEELGKQLFQYLSISG